MTTGSNTHPTSDTGKIAPMEQDTRGKQHKNLALEKVTVLLNTLALQPMKSVQLILLVIVKLVIFLTFC